MRQASAVPEIDDPYRDAILGFFSTAFSRTDIQRPRSPPGGCGAFRPQSEEQEEWRELLTPARRNHMKRPTLEQMAGSVTNDLIVMLNPDCALDTVSAAREKILSGDPRPSGRTHNTGTKADLEAAGIPVLHESEKTGLAMGYLAGWSFTFNNYYWVAKSSDGAPLPHDYAVPLHNERGKEVRVAGLCGCPHPLEWYHPSRGFAGVPDYHVDSVEGLTALADAIRRWRDEMAPEAGMSVHDWQHAKARREDPPHWTHHCAKCEYMGSSMVRMSEFGGSERHVEWYACKTGRELDGRKPYDPTRKDCCGRPAELLRTSIIGRFGNEPGDYWSLDCKTIAEWYDPSRNNSPDDLIDAAQAKIMEFEIWSVQFNRPDEIDQMLLDFGGDAVVQAFRDPDKRAKMRRYVTEPEEHVAVRYTTRLARVQNIGFILGPQTE